MQYIHQVRWNVLLVQHKEKIAPPSNFCWQNALAFPSQASQPPPSMKPWNHVKQHAVHRLKAEWWDPYVEATSCVKRRRLLDFDAFDMFDFVNHFKEPKTSTKEHPRVIKPCNVYALLSLFMLHLEEKPPGSGPKAELPGYTGLRQMCVHLNDSWPCNEQCAFSLQPFSYDWESDIRYHLYINILTMGCHMPCAGWPTAGPSSDAMLLKTRSCAVEGHVDWVTWTREAQKKAPPKQRLFSRRVPPNRWSGIPRKGWKKEDLEGDWPHDFWEANQK